MELFIGLWLYAAGALKQIWDEWPERGLTDTSPSALVLSGAGCGLVAHAYWPGSPYLVAAGVIPGLLFAGMLGWKFWTFLRARRWV